MATLETDRLILRDFALSDWDALNAIVTDPAVTRFTHFGGWDETKRRQWLERMVQEASGPHPYTDNWAITLRGDGQLIGWLFIGGSGDAVKAGTRGCGYALAPHVWGHGVPHWGQGYMPEALRAAFAYELTVLGNTASARTVTPQIPLPRGSWRNVA